MDYYKFLGTPLKVHHVMAIQKLSMNSYNVVILYNIVMLNPFSI